MTSNSEILKRARDCERKGDYDGAAYEYRTLAEADPCPPIAFNFLGDLYHRKGEQDEAARWYQKAVERYAQESLYGNAIGVCRKILRQYPHRVQAVEQLGGLFFSQGLAREAVKHYMVFAARMAEIGDGDAVLRTGARIREILAGDPEVRERLGEIFLALSLPDEGIVDLRAALHVYREKGRIADADRVAQRLHELENARPVDPLSLMESGEAETPLDLAALSFAGNDAGFEPLDHSRAEPIPRPVLGEAHIDSIEGPTGGPGDRPGAETAREPREEPVTDMFPVDSLDEDVKSFPRSAGPSSEDVEILLPGSPFTDPAHAGPGEEGPGPGVPDDEDFVPVREILREFQNGVAKIIGNGDFQSHYDMGMSYKEMGLYEEALREFEVASGSPELGPSCEEMRAAVLIDLGRFQECAHLLRGLVARDENDGVGIHFLLGLAYEKLDQKELALREYRLVEERDPEFRDVRVRIAQL